MSQELIVSVEERLSALEVATSEIMTRLDSLTEQMLPFFRDQDLTLTEMITSATTLGEVDYVNKFNNWASTYRSLLANFNNNHRALEHFAKAYQRQHRNFCLWSYLENPEVEALLAEHYQRYRHLPALQLEDQDPLLVTGNPRPSQGGRGNGRPNGNQGREYVLAVDSDCNEPYPLSAQSILADGAKVYFLREPPQDHVVPDNFVPSRHLDIVRKLVMDLVQRNVLYAVERPQVRNYMSMKTRERPGEPERPRIIMDGSSLTTYLTKFSLHRMPTLNNIIDVVEKFNFGAKLDLSEAYYSIRIHADSQKYLGLHFEGTHYLWRGAPLGLGTSAFACQKVTASLASLICYYILVYYDDFLVCGVDEEEVHDKMQRLVQLLEQSELPINMQKSEFRATRMLEFLQYRLDFGRHAVFVGTSLKKRIFAAVYPFYSEAPSMASVEHLSSLLSSAVPTHALRNQVRDLIRSLRQHVSAGTARELITPLWRLVNACVCTPFEPR
ncbi:protein P [Acrasis kona]|uniref:Protein P n=1 Tax=Acrasis kona TaxID=1008807 RepID=A0AAW2YMS6_9EUKA